MPTVRTLWHVETRRRPPMHDTLTISECQEEADALSLARHLGAARVYRVTESSESRTSTRELIYPPEAA